MIPSNHIRTASVAVHGMTCQHCADSVTKGLAQLEGIDIPSIDVDLDSRKATFSYTGTEINKESISKAIEELGYDAGTPQLEIPTLTSSSSSSSDLEHARIGISGMTCSHCVNSVTRALSELDGIEKESIVVNLEENRAEFDYVPGRSTEEDIRDAIDSAGYDVDNVEMPTSSTNPSQTPSHSTLLNLIVSGMTCEHCSSTIRNGIQGLQSVQPESISIEVPTGKVTLLVSGEGDIIDAIMEKIDDLGYEVTDWKKETLSDPQSNICSAHINIQGMTCSHCTSTVHNALSDHPGVIRESVSVDLDHEVATLLYNDAETSLEGLREVIEDAGYDVDNIISSPANASSTLDNKSMNDVKLRKAVFRVLGMTCDSCSSAVSEILKILPGALPDSVCVGLHTEMGMVVFEGDAITPQIIAEKLDDAGYEANNIQIIHNLLPPKVMDEAEENDQDDNSSFVSLNKVVSHISEASLTGISISSARNDYVQVVSMQVSGMTCASCVGTVEKNIKSWDGVVPDSVTVNLLTNNATFKMENNSLNAKEITKKITKLGYKASDIHITSKGATIATFSAKLQVQMMVTGMYCNKCETKVKAALQELPGIISNSISVSYETGKVKFQLDRNVTTQRQIQRIVQKLGFSAESIDITKMTSSEDEAGENKRGDENLVNTRLIVTGMTCSSCVSNIEKTLLRHDGINKAQVNLLAKSAFISHNPSKIGSRDLVNMIEQIGYKAELAPDEDKSNQRDSMKARMKKEERLLRSRFLWSLLFAIPVLLISMIFMMALPSTDPVRQQLSKEVVPNLTIANLVLFILCTPVQFILGSSFYIKAYRSLRYAHTANMETLVALGTSVAYFASVGTVAAAMAKPDSMAEPMNYFETSVFLITFIHLGKWLEALAKGKTAETITKLMDLQPEKAILVTVSYEEKGETPRQREILEESQIETKDIQGE